MASIPKEGFIKLSLPEQIEVSPEKRVALIRKGNELFNDGDVSMAKKVFLSVGYCDGLVRVGDYLYAKADYLEAYRMYTLAPDPAKATFIAEKMAGVVREWLVKDGGNKSE